MLMIAAIEVGSADGAASDVRPINKVFLAAPVYAKRLLDAVQRQNLTNFKIIIIILAYLQIAESKVVLGPLAMSISSGVFDAR